MKVKISYMVTKEIEIDHPIYDSSEVVRWLNNYRDTHYDPGTFEFDIIQRLHQAFCKKFRYKENNT